MAACPDPVDLVVEIGPGRGGLTDQLLHRAQRVVAIEIDPVLVLYLRSKYRDQPRVEIVESDILKADLSQWRGAPVVGNLPYYITSPIVERVLSLRPPAERAVFLVQKEVAIRMTCGPGSRDYGYLSVLTQFYATAQMLFTIPPGAFKPPPKVESALVCLNPRADFGSITEPAKFLRFVGHCFRHKRKTLRNNLAGVIDAGKLEAASLGKQRAEALSLSDLIELFRKLA